MNDEQQHANPCPGFVIIGAQKAATTFLHACLSAHPELLMAPGECSIFEDPDYSGESFAGWQRAMRARARGRLIGIKRPDYLAKEEVPARIAQHAPGVRLVAMLRDPVRRAVSAYFHLARGGSLPLAPIDAAMRKLLDGEWEPDWPLARTIFDYGAYGTGLRRYLDHFPREQILILIQEQVLAAKDEALRGLCRFLGVAEAGVELDPGRVRQEGVYSPLRLRLHQLRARVGMQRFHGGRRVRRHPNPLRRALAGAVFGLDRALFKPLCNNRQPRLSAEIEAELRARFAPEVEIVEALTGGALDSWKGAAPDAVS